MRRSACAASGRIALHCIALHALGRSALLRTLAAIQSVVCCSFVCLQLKSLREQLHIADGSLGLQRQQHDAFVSAYDVR